MNYTDLDQYLEQAIEKFRDYQIEAYKQLIDKDNSVLDADMGSGKTFITLAACFARRPKKVLILCSKNALYTWPKELLKWFKPWANCQIISGKRIPAERKKLWTSDVLFTTCTYATFKNDFETLIKQDWDFVICDEYHKSGLRNKNTKMSKMFKAFKDGTDYIEYMPKSKKVKRRVQVKRRVRYSIPLTGTPVSRGFQDLWAMLHCLNPQKFSSYWKFINKFGLIHQGPFGMEIKGVARPDKLKAYISSNYVRISRKITDKQLPPRTRESIEIDMTDKQLKAYKSIDETMMLYSDSGLMLTPTTLAQMTRLRQLVACPKILGIDCYGAGVQNVLDMMEDAEDYHGVIFTSYKSAIPFYEEFFKKHTKVPVDYLWGGMEADEVKAKTERFRRDRGIMLCSIKFSQSFELETAKRCWLISYDPDPNENEQAEGRIRRASSTMDPMFAYYVKHRVPGTETTVDDRCVEILNDKTRQTKQTYQAFD